MAFVNINAGELSINLLDVISRNDTLFVKYRVRNLTNKKLVVYNIKYCDYSLSKKRKSTDTIPGVKVLMLRNGICPMKRDAFYGFKCIFPTFDRNKFMRDMILSHVDEYEIFDPNQEKEYNIRLDILYARLNSGKYKAQLIFYSSDYYLTEFENNKLKNDSLKQSQYFFTIPVYSNRLTFNYKAFHL